MASNAPTQVRAVDPFASYNSDTVNKLSRMLTFGEDGLAITRACDVILDTTSSTQVTLLPGVVFKDDVWIEISSQHTVDFTDSEHYYDFDTGFDEPGYYYVVLEYIFAKQRPAPEAKILIVKPSQRGAYAPGGQWVFLKAVYVTGTGPFSVDSVYNSDPENTDNRRLTIPHYTSTDQTIPTFNQSTDQSRLLYVEEEDEFYSGYSDGWRPVGAGGNSLQINTTGFSVGDLVYMGLSGSLTLANASLPYSTADGVVTKVGTSGRIQMSGSVTNVPIETGASVSVGNLLYLSKTEGGKVTSQSSAPFYQFIGRCTEIVDSTSVTILFVRGEPSSASGGGGGSSSLAGFVWATLSSGGSWTLSGGLYYQDVDVSDLSGQDAAITLYDTATALKIEPEDLEYINDDTLRVWMPVNTKQLGFLAIGPSSSTITTANVYKVTDTLSSGSWNSAGGLYYQDVNISSISGQTAIVLAIDTSTNKKDKPYDIEYATASTLRIWTSDNSKEYKIIAIGAGSGTSIVSLNAILSSGASWISSGGQYYQDISLTSLGTDDVVLEFFDDTTSERIEPADVEFTGSNVVRIWMPDNTHTINVTIIG
jgi:hypothetical protein